MLLFSSKDGAIQSLVIFRVDNSVEFPGAWKNEEEDELQEGSGESVSFFFKFFFVLMKRRMSSEKEVGRVLVWEPRWVRWVSAC